jgi:hypothetical protein
MRFAVNIRAPETPVQTATTMGGIAMLENIVKLIDVLEDMIANEDATDPKDSDKLVSISSRLEAIVMDIKEKTDTP